MLILQSANAPSPFLLPHSVWGRSRVVLAPSLLFDFLLEVSYKSICVDFSLVFEFPSLSDCCTLKKFLSIVVEI
jgi:hypothetical protein